MTLAPSESALRKPDGSLYHAQRIFDRSGLWINEAALIASNAPTPLDRILHPQHHPPPMKAAARNPNRKPAEKPRPRMTREIAEARAVGGGKGKFDGVAFLRTLKK